MKICLHCGCRDNPYWHNSRFEWDADEMRFEEFMREYPTLAMILWQRRNHSAIRQGPYSYYRRGTDGLMVYRVLTEDLNMPRERKNHKTMFCEATECK